MKVTFQRIVPIVAQGTLPNFPPPNKEPVFVAPGRLMHLQFDWSGVKKGGQRDGGEGGGGNKKNGRGRRKSGGGGAGGGDDGSGGGTVDERCEFFLILCFVV